MLLCATLNDRNEPGDEATYAALWDQCTVGKLSCVCITYCAVIPGGRGGGGHTHTTIWGGKHTYADKPLLTLYKYIICVQHTSDARSA